MSCKTAEAKEMTKKTTPKAPDKASKTPDTHHNRLIHEKSPYLLQHAENPVDWYAWGEEAFARAHKENKPIFLSIGYSTCHWCHVMAHESFEDPAVAKLMNEAFVCIKVDREERPDLDNIYMRVCQMLTGSGGWPLTIFMTPDKEPFFAATYIARETRFGRAGMLDLIPQINRIWAQRKHEVLSSAGKITAALKETEQLTPGGELSKDTLQQAFDELSQRFDENRGGFSRAPKFPAPHNLLFLLRYWYHTGSDRALHMVEKTLQEMRCGGIYDHIGFGFHRYATDPEWLVPHFEKMLYDQALLIMTYADAFQATHKRLYEQTVHEITTYVLRSMTAANGGFYSGEDADSEGQEGKFYVWTEAEIRQALRPDEAALILKTFNITQAGNFLDEATRQHTGANIFHLNGTFCEVARHVKLSEHELQVRFETIRQKLFSVREQRVHPHKDDKILTDWNGLMIAALARAAQVFAVPAYAEAAQRAVSFILKTLRTPDGRLLHRFRDGEAAVAGMVDDYAFFIWGLIELYEATFDVAYLQTALELQQDMLKHFWNEPAGGFYFTADDAEQLLLRQKEIYDGAIPSGNAVAMLNLLRLSRITAQQDFEHKALSIARAFSGSVQQLPSAYTQLMVALDFAVNPSSEVVIAGKTHAPDTEGLINAVRKAFVPNKVLLLRPTDQKAPAITAIAPYTKELKELDGKAAAYVCRNYTCSLPTTSAEKMLELLMAKK
jgi:uncharacterized protein YyaL (SSP411 family)